MGNFFRTPLFPSIVQTSNGLSWSLVITYKAPHPFTLPSVALSVSHCQCRAQTAVVSCLVFLNATSDHVTVWVKFFCGAKSWPVIKEANLDFIHTCPPLTISALCVAGCCVTLTPGICLCMLPSSTTLLSYFALQGTPQASSVLSLLGTVEVPLETKHWTVHSLQAIKLSYFLLFKAR